MLYKLQYLNFFETLPPGNNEKVIICIKVNYFGNYGQLYEQIGQYIIDWDRILYESFYRCGGLSDDP